MSSRGPFFPLEISSRLLGERKRGAHRGRVLRSAVQQALRVPRHSVLTSVRTFHSLSPNLQGLVTRDPGCLVLPRALQHQRQFDKTRTQLQGTASVFLPTARNGFMGQAFGGLQVTFGDRVWS